MVLDVKVKKSELEKILAPIDEHLDEISGENSTQEQMKAYNLFIQYLLTDNVYGAIQIAEKNDFPEAIPRYLKDSGVKARITNYYRDIGSRIFKKS